MVARQAMLDYFLLCSEFSITQVAVWLVITSKTSSLLSIFGNSYIIKNVLWDLYTQNKSTCHCIMLGLSCSDVIYSFLFFLGSWVMPKGEQLFTVAGSEFTCNVAGFLFISSYYPCTLLYSCSLATYYLLKIKVLMG